MVERLRPIAEAHPEAEAVWERMGNAYGMLKQYPKATHAWRKALELDENRSHYLNNYAWFASLAEVELEQALQAAEKAVAMEAQPAYLDTLGWVRYKLDDYEGATDALKQALQAATQLSNPDRRASNLAAATYHLGVIYARQGRHEEAAQLFQQSINIQSNGEFTEDARHWLNRLSAPTVGA